MIIPKDDVEIVNSATWKKTIRKQRLYLIRRAQAAQQLEETVGGDGLENDVDTTSEASHNFVKVHQGSRLASSQVSAPVVNLVSDDSDSDEAPQSPVLQASGKLKARSPSPETDYNDDEALICTMASIAVSSPPTPVPTITTPGKGGKHYVVSVGRRTGVFDNWPYTHSLTSGVAGNCFKSYQTYEEAWEVYLDLKKKGVLKVVRNVGDDVVFGSLENAIQ